MSAVKIIKVAMADLNVARQGCSLQTAGLGSCVGVTLYDPVAKVAGLAHVMLPSSEIAREEKLNVAKYADTAIPEMIRLLQSIGAVISRLEAKLAGGAQMFSFGSFGGDMMRIGPRNVESCKLSLKKFNIPVKAEDTGGNYGRTIEMQCDTGKLIVRSFQYGIKEL
jgi:chemotaxis protein CheD